jgi:hypothetical protein
MGILLLGASALAMRRSDRIRRRAGFVTDKP